MTILIWFQRFHAASHAYVVNLKSIEDEKLKLMKRDFVFLEAEKVRGLIKM